MVEKIQSASRLEEVKEMRQGYLINQRLDDRIDIVHPLPLTSACAHLLAITAHTEKFYAATYRDMRLTVGGRAWNYCPNCHRS